MQSRFVQLALLSGLFWLASAGAQDSLSKGLGAPEAPLAHAQSADPRLRVLVPSPDLRPSQLAIVVNLRDPQSVEVAQYYQEVYGLKDDQRIELDFEPANDIAFEDFAVLRSEVHRRLEAGIIQALAISWTRPYRITFAGNTCALGVTSGFAFSSGFEKYCDLNNNKRSTWQKIWGTRPPLKFALIRSQLFDGQQYLPYKESRIVPAMMLAGHSTQDVKALIDRGFASRSKYHPPKVHLVLSHDLNRPHPREADFRSVVDAWWGRIEYKPTLWTPKQGELDVLTGQKDVGVYLIGRETLPRLSENSFIPGAAVDSLTSYGGYLLDPRGQVTALEILEAGATGSYGTIAEPRPLAERFPNASVFLRKYLGGSTLIQAYWHSVEDPLLGVFVGDPLARPYGNQVEFDEKTRTLKITAVGLEQGREYEVMDYTPFNQTLYPSFKAEKSPHTITIPNADPTHLYRVGPCHPRHGLVVND